MLYWSFQHAFRGFELNCTYDAVAARVHVIHYGQRPCSTILAVGFHYTSPSLGWNLVTACVRLCLSLSAVRYSLCQRLHILSLQVCRYLACLQMSRFVILQVSSPGNWFVCWYKKVAGVKIGNSMSSST